MSMLLLVGGPPNLAMSLKLSPPVRRTASKPIVPLSEHLYSVGASKLRREATINGISAVDFICWPFVKGVLAQCDCGGQRAHLFQGYCGRAISGALGAGTGCNRGSDTCDKAHPVEENVLQELVDWHTKAIGPATVGKVSLIAQRSDGELSRSAATAAGVASGASDGDGTASVVLAAAKSCASAEHVLSRLHRHTGTSTHLQQLLVAPFLQEMLSSESTRRLLSGRAAPKEISEAYSVVGEIRRLASALGAPADDLERGRGLTILDVCSGKGVVAALISRLLPQARVVMLDACPDMDLSHVASRSNLEFIELDLFSKEAGALLHELASQDPAVTVEQQQQQRQQQLDATAPPAAAMMQHDAADCRSSPPFRATLAIGMHLCGALSPRLLVLASLLDDIDAVSVCPCCLKGTLGDYVKKGAKAASRPNYDVLLETLSALTARELGERGRVFDVRRDEQLLSPRNGYVSLIKSPQASRREASRREAGRASATMSTASEASERVSQQLKQPEQAAVDGAGNAELAPEGANEEDCSAARDVRYRARVLYDGAEFLGMQKQPSGKSVACAIEAALTQRMGGARVVVHPAGRTDTHVHARGQAVHFDLPQVASSSRTLPTGEALQRSLNSMLPVGLQLADVEVAPELDSLGRRWHARLWATGKLYSYRLHFGQVADPLDRRQRAHFGHRRLDLALMSEAASHLEGEIDCAAFANRRAGEALPFTHEVEKTMRRIRRVQVVDEGDGRVRIDFHVQAALYKMVRNLTALLVSVGQGLIAPAEVPALIASRDRSKLPAPAPAHGLTLESVYYAEGWDLRYAHPLHPASS